MEQIFTENTAKVRSYDEYLRRYLPELDRANLVKTATPADIGTQMALATLKRVQKALLKEQEDGPAPTADKE